MSRNNGMRQNKQYSLEKNFLLRLILFHFFLHGGDCRKIMGQWIVTGEMIQKREKV